MEAFGGGEEEEDGGRTNPSCPKEINLHLSITFSPHSQRSSLCQSVRGYFFTVCHGSYSCLHTRAYKHLVFMLIPETLSRETRRRPVGLCKCHGKESSLSGAISAQLFCFLYVSAQTRSRALTHAPFHELPAGEEPSRSKGTIERRPRGGLHGREHDRQRRTKTSEA